MLNSLTEVALSSFDVCWTCTEVISVTALDGNATLQMYREASTSLVVLGGVSAAPTCCLALSRVFSTYSLVKSRIWQAGSFQG